MGVVCVVRRVPQMARYRSTQQKRINPILNRERLILIKRQQYKRPIIVKRRVRKQRGQPKVKPGRSKVDRGVVSVVDHVGRDEDPLGEGGGVEVAREVVEVAVQGEAGGEGGDGVVEDCGVVLADVVGVGGGGGVEVVGGGEAGHERLIRREWGGEEETHLNPSNPSVGRFSWYDAHEMFLLSSRSTIVDTLPNVSSTHNSNENTEKKYALGRDVVVVVVRHRPKVASRGSSIVGLGGMSDGVVLAEKNALLFERLERLRRCSVVVIRVL